MTTVMNDLLLDLGNTTIKSIEMSLQIAGGIRIDYSVSVDLIGFPLLH
jgi:hypothetical protein